MAIDSCRPLPTRGRVDLATVSSRRGRWHRSESLQHRRRRGNGESVPEGHLAPDGFISYNNYIVIEEHIGTLVATNGNWWLETTFGPGNPPSIWFIFVCDRGVQLVKIHKSWEFLGISSILASGTCKSPISPDLAPFARRGMKFPVKQSSCIWAPKPRLTMSCSHCSLFPSCSVGKTPVGLPVTHRRALPSLGLRP